MTLPATASNSEVEGCVNTVAGTESPRLLVSAYVCPDCETPLEALRCSISNTQYSDIDGIPILLSRDPDFQRAWDIAESYDGIYRQHPNAWEREGRTAELFAYLAALLRRQSEDGRFLEIGCGEGHLLAAVTFPEKFAVDLSLQAIRTACMRTDACFSVALAERLPFPANFFDVIASVGVTEHFLDMAAASRQIRRVLKPGGTYVLLTHVAFSLRDRAAAKVSEYLFPRPRLIPFTRWLKTKLRPAIKPDFIPQLVQNRYTLSDVKTGLERSGLKVTEVITTRTHRNAPLVGPWVVICIAKK